MKIDDFINDKALSAVSLVLLLLWAGMKYRVLSLPRLDSETAASTALRIACGFLLLGASLSKLGDAADFLGLIKQCYFIIPDPLKPLTAVVVPWLEFFTGLCLIFGFHWRPAALVFCGLMAVYSLAILGNLLQGIDCDCGCFGKGEKMTWLSVIRDLLFLGMGYIVLVSPRTYAALDRLNDQKGRS